MAISHLQTTQIQPEEEQKPELNEVIKQNSELNDKINRIINSKSWKVTAPIRNFNTRIRGKK